MCMSWYDDLHSLFKSLVSTLYYPARALIGQKPMFYQGLYNNQINARVLIG